MHRKIFIVAAVITIIAAFATVALITRGDSGTGRKDDSGKQDSSSNVSVAKEGIFECLTMKDPSGPQTLECSFGLRTDDGTTYALYAQDPSLLGGIPMGTRIRATGPITEETTKYGTAGTIRLTSVERL
ncbi:MAG TPA: hypothetical protein VFM05_00990 [Candidatus Saccharimonadales bacterium]|nr:hypothetical protein [Candidatus Saccharimonadales bacterium]